MKKTKPGISVWHLVMWFFLNLYVKNEVSFCLESKILNGVCSRVQPLNLHLMLYAIMNFYSTQIDTYVTPLAGILLWVVRAFLGGGASYLCGWPWQPIFAMSFPTSRLISPSYLASVHLKLLAVAFGLNWINTKFILNPIFIFCLDMCFFV